MYVCIGGSQGVRYKGETRRGLGRAGDGACPCGMAHNGEVGERGHAGWMCREGGPIGRGGSEGSWEENSEVAEL